MENVDPIIVKIIGHRFESWWNHHLYWKSLTYGIESGGPGSLGLSHSGASGAWQPYVGIIRHAHIEMPRHTRLPEFPAPAAHPLLPESFEGRLNSNPFIGNGNYGFLPSYLSHPSKQIIVPTLKAVHVTV